MGTKKSNKLYAAAAALAVTASAVAPGLTADAASKVTVKSVTNPASISHYGGYTFAVKKLSLPKTVKVLLSNKKYENRSVKWGKVSYDKKYIGKYQTISGTVSGTTKKASIKVKLNNYPVDVVEPKLAPVAVGEKLNLPSTIDVKYKDGKVIARSAKSFNLTAEKTDKAGEMKLSYNYMGKNSSIKGSIAYEVKAAEITNVMNEIKDDMLSVSADVKYPAKDAKAQLLIFPGKDESKALPAIDGKLEDGKFKAEAKEIPTGTHSFAIKVGDVVSPAKEFSIEAPMVKGVKAINATQVEVSFNRSVDASTVFTNGVSGAFKSGTDVTLTTIDGVTSGALTGTLSEDGKTLTITSANALSKRYDVLVDGIKTKDGKAIAKYKQVVEFAADTVAPSVVSTVKKTASTFTVKFSEPMSTLGTVSYKLADGTSVASTGNGVTNDFAPGAQEVTFTVGSDVAAGKQVTATFIGAQDQALNIISPNPATVSFIKGDKDGVAPTVTSLVAINNKTIEVKFSEELQANPVVTGFAGTLTFKQDTADKTKYTITSNTANTGLKAVSVSAGYTDLSGELGAAYSKVLNFDIDTVAPKVASTKVVKIDGVEYLEVAFDEVVETEATLASLEVTGNKVSNFVTSSLTTVTVPVAKFVQVSTDKKVYRITLSDLLGVNSTKDASYSLDITGKTSVPGTVKLVSDLSGNAGPTTFKASVIRSEDTTAPTTNKATLDTTFSSNGIQVNANKTITVRFNQELDGASATNVANYKFDGAVVEKAVLSPFGTPAGKQDVTLTLKDGSNVFTGLRNVTISGVQAKNGLAMDSVNTQESLVENVAPTVSSAKLTAPGVITLTFSENVYNATDVAADDFDLYVGGVKVTSTLDTEDVAKGSAKNTLTLTVGGTALTADDLAKGLSIKSVEGLDIMDANDNVLSVGTVAVAQ